MKVKAFCTLLLLVILESPNFALSLSYFEPRCISALLNGTYGNCKETLQKCRDDWSICEVNNCEDHKALFAVTQKDNMCNDMMVCRFWCIRNKHQLILYYIINN